MGCQGEGGTSYGRERAAGEKGTDGVSEWVGDSNLPRITDLVVVLVDTHLNIEPHELRQVTVGVRILSPEDATDLKHAGCNVRHDRHLLVQLRRLGKARGAVEVVEVENGRTSLARASEELGSVDREEADALAVLAELTLNSSRVAQDGLRRSGAVVQPAHVEALVDGNGGAVGVVVRPVGVSELEGEHAGGGGDDVELGDDELEAAEGRGRGLDVGLVSGESAEGADNVDDSLGVETADVLNGLLRDDDSRVSVGGGGGDDALDVVTAGAKHHEADAAAARADGVHASADADHGAGGFVVSIGELDPLLPGNDGRADKGGNVPLVAEDSASGGIASSGLLSHLSIKGGLLCKLLSLLSLLSSSLLFSLGGHECS